MKKIEIKTEYITLGQFLKYVSIIGSGAEAKEFLQSVRVYVNGEEENRRGRKLYPEYTVEVLGEKYIIVG